MTMLFSISVFWMVELSPMLVYGPMTQLRPTTAGPLMDDLTQKGEARDPLLYSLWQHYMS